MQKRLNICFLALLLILETNSLDNGVGLTPPMGWNSWNPYGCFITEDLMIQ